MLACWLAIPGTAGTPVDSLAKIFLVAGLGLLPMFLVMEINPGIPSAGYWGLQDTFVAAVAALALACIFKGVEKAWVLYSTAGMGLAALTLWIKPVGALILPAIFGFWVVECAFRIAWSDKEARRCGSSMWQKRFP